MAYGVRYSETRHAKLALAGMANAVKILRAMQPHFERAGCAEWIRRMISVEATRLASLRAEAERSIHEQEVSREPLAATASPHEPAPTA
jgi:hypothetical protein